MKVPKTAQPLSLLRSLSLDYMHYDERKGGCASPSALQPGQAFWYGSRDPSCMSDPKLHSPHFSCSARRHQHFGCAIGYQVQHNIRISSSSMARLTNVSQLPKSHRIEEPASPADLSKRIRSEYSLLSKGICCANYPMDQQR